MNKYYNKLLWRPTNFRAFHLRDRHCSVMSNRSTTNCHCSIISSSNVNYDDGNFRRSFVLAARTMWELNNRHRLLTTLKAHSHQHFCTSSTTTSSISSDQTINKLPDPIEQQCEQWTQILRAEWEARVVEEQHDWNGVKLKCTYVKPGLNTSTLKLSTENLSSGQWRLLRQTYRVGDTVELKQQLPSQTAGHQTHSQLKQSDDSIDPTLDNNMLGIVVKLFPYAISIRINRRLNIQEAQSILRCSFDIKKTENPRLLENRLNFLGKRHSDWHKWPGYATMLQAFKCQPLPEGTGVDPVDWVGSHGKDLDPSQCKALSAALNLKRPIVAVHGPPGSGKTHILAEYLHVLSQQGKTVLILSPSNSCLYQLLAAFCKKFPAAASSEGTFLYLKHFDAKLASKVIADEAIEKLVEKNSISQLQTNIDEKTRANYELTHTLKSTMEKRPADLREEDVLREAEEEFEQMREISHQMREKETKNLLQGISLLFTNTSNSTLNMFIRLGLTFDAVIIDDAALFTEFESWWMALPTAPVLRLFGDYNQQGIPVHSSMGRELNFDKSLLQRLDEQFGAEVNFHLRRQYRSNAAIQAWPNRAFYGQRAAEPDESVRDIRLDDLLEEGKSAPPEFIRDPLVLVDLGQLEGEWRDWMFKAEERGNSWLNWGEAFLTASHIWHLFEHIPQLCPSKIAYSTHHNAQRNLLWEILFVSAFSGPHFDSLMRIRMERGANLQGQQFDVVLRDSVTAAKPDEFTDPYNLKHLNNEMCRARRQFIWFANSKWLEEGSEQSRLLLRTFHDYGRIVGPNQLLQFEPGQFSEMTKKVQENYYKQMRGM